MIEAPLMVGSQHYAKKHTNTIYTAGKCGPRYLGWVGGKLERWEATAAERMNGRMEED